MNMKFVDRKSELSILEEEFKKTPERASMTIVYGRRRIGKTELIKQFMSKKDHIYFLATLQSREDVVKAFSLRAAEFFADRAAASSPHTAWEGFFEYLAREIKSRKKPLVLIFDEFTYLVQQDRATPSIFQYYWDEHLKNLPVMLILCGSYVGMMEREVLAYRSPLYGRRTRELFITEIEPRYLKEFLPGYSAEELVQAHAILGGVPFHLKQFDSSKGVLENIKENFLQKDKALFNDALLLLREELKEPRNYLSILKAIAFGKTTPKEIADESHLDKPLVGKYLYVLKGMKLVKRVVPVTERNPERSKKGLYIIGDNYFNFWLRFVYPFLDYVEEGRVDELMQAIVMPNLNSFVGRAFEGLARRAMIELNKRKELPFSFERIGPWWHRGVEIDLVALNNRSREILFTEVKWTDLGGRDVERLMRGLEKKAERVGWRKRARKEHYGLVAKKIEGKKGLRGRHGWLLLDLDDMAGLLFG